MNKGWYDQLSTAQRQVIDDHCNNEWAAKVGTAWGDEEDSGAAKLAEMGGGQTIVKLTPDQLDKWKKAVTPVYDMWAKAMPAGSADPVEVLDEYRRELTARNAAY
ncbi:hypothetical protein PA01_00490 [Azoarcus sp. PA01]|nr:hypothetical protein PA01_19740 [Azoarcus sp. PA01]KON82551.1 hypothetical protein PA01_00490 [Azoarcus sp. PA01]